jgi:hypothetical protein
MEREVAVSSGKAIGGIGALKTARVPAAIGDLRDRIDGAWQLLDELEQKVDDALTPIPPEPPHACTTETGSGPRTPESNLASTILREAARVGDIERRLRKLIGRVEL